MICPRCTKQTEHLRIVKWGPDIIYVCRWCERKCRNEEGLGSKDVNTLREEILVNTMGLS